MDIHLLAPRDLEKSFKCAANQRTQQTRWLIFKGKALNNPSYRPNKPFEREDEIENAGPEPRMFRKDENDFL